MIQKSMKILLAISIFCISVAAIYAQKSDLKVVTETKKITAEELKSLAKPTDKKPVLINFWATWCIQCKAEIPWFNQFEKDYKSRGLEVVGVSLDEEGAAKVKPFLKDNPINYAVALGDKAVSNAFKVDGEKLPVTLLVDKQGRIRFTHVGIAKKEEFEAEINQLLNE